MKKLFVILILFLIPLTILPQTDSINGYQKSKWNDNLSTTLDLYSQFNIKIHYNKEYQTYFCDYTTKINGDNFTVTFYFNKDTLLETIGIYSVKNNFNKNNFYYFEKMLVEKYGNYSYEHNENNYITKMERTWNFKNTTIDLIFIKIEELESTNLRYNKRNLEDNSF